jgi:hypothetical protein
VPLSPEYRQTVKANYAAIRQRAWQKPNGLDFELNPGGRAASAQVRPADVRRCTAALQVRVVAVHAAPGTALHEHHAGQPARVVGG